MNKTKTLLKKPTLSGILNIVYIATLLFFSNLTIEAMQKWKRNNFKYKQQNYRQFVCL